MKPEDQRRITLDAGREGISHFEHPAYLRPTGPALCQPGPAARVPDSPIRSAPKLAALWGWRRSTWLVVRPRPVSSVLGPYLWCSSSLAARTPGHRPGLAYGRPVGPWLHGSGKS
jgi:hypothetical protein